jgi:hypothetical protein
MTANFSEKRSLRDLESVLNTRTRVWLIRGEVEVCLKLETDVNGQEWYVYDVYGGSGNTFKGEVPCWSFPHFNGAYDTYSYVPVPHCFKTIEELMASTYIGLDAQKSVWAYDVDEYARCLTIAESMRSTHQ